MRKLITLNTTQGSRLIKLMEELGYTSVSQFVAYLVIHYDETKKRPAGRPRSTKDEDQEEDNARYWAPDYPDNQNKYTLDELEAWYEYDERRGAMPPKEELKRADSPTKG